MGESAHDPTLHPLHVLEEARIARRRERLTELAPDTHVSPDAPVIGLALSGGGIRSATFCLGVLQSLARARRLRRVDLLSTVSGGGYIGSFLGALVGRPDPDADADVPSVIAAETTLADTNAGPIRWLRENGRYLAPKGAVDLRMALAVCIRNWVAIHVVLGVFVLFAILLGHVALSAVFATLGASTARAVTALLPGRATPFVWLPVLTFLLWSIPVGWLYWLVPTGSGGRRDRDFSLLVVLGVLAACAFGLAQRPSGASALAWSYGTLVAVFGAAFTIAARVIARTKSANSVYALRRALSDALASSLLVTFALLAFALIDTAGYALAVTAARQGWTGIEGRAWSVVAAIGSAGIASGFGPRIMSLVSGRGGTSRLKLPLAILALVPALALVALVTIAITACAYLLGWGFPWNHGEPPGLDKTWLVASVLISGLLSVAFGGTFSFANTSSLASMYAQRLTRAYLGASNPARVGKHRTPKGLNADEPIDGDDAALDEYHDRLLRGAGPLHIVNVTLNETINPSSSIVQGDRKGLPVAIGPAGVSVGVHHHANWVYDADARAQGLNANPPVLPGTPQDTRFRVFPPRPTASDPSLPDYRPEKLTIGQWVSISGAAFNTAMGQLTSIGISLLAGLFNARVGYWWDSGVPPRWRRHVTRRGIGAWLGRGFAWVFAVQDALFSELGARLQGSARRNWMLSDGGHFENTATYELIRRRPPLMIVCDCGADPAYGFADLANLVEKARLDFGAEIEFVRPDAVLPADVPPSVREQFGSLAQLAPEEGVSTRHAAIATVRYDRSAVASSLIVWIKPTIGGDEPVDIRSYKTRCHEFPNETTVDQFFDEKQWESYRKLGEHIGSKIFDARAAAAAVPVAAPVAASAPSPTAPGAAVALEPAIAHAALARKIDPDALRALAEMLS